MPKTTHCSAPEGLAIRHVAGVHALRFASLLHPCPSFGVAPMRQGFASLKCSPVQTRFARLAAASALPLTPLHSKAPQNSLEQPFNGFKLQTNTNA